jgi:hypothetical protein
LKSPRRIDIIFKACLVSRTHILFPCLLRFSAPGHFQPKVSIFARLYFTLNHTSILYAHCAATNITANHSSSQEDLSRKTGQTQASDLAKLVMSHHLAPSSANTSTTSSPSIFPNADKSSPAVKHPDGSLPPPAFAPDGNISHALKSLRDFDAIKRDRVAYDSPYAMSNASTAPGSPRM